MTEERPTETPAEETAPAASAGARADSRPDTQADTEPEGTAAPPQSAGTGEPEESVESVEAEGDPLADAQQKVAELTTDLQRLQAEYVNYKRRVDRDRELISQNATFKVLSPIIDVLDTIDRAREHGEVEGGFKAVADQLERIVANLGLTRFGEPGEAFDPTLHEALSHMGTDPEVKETTIKVLAKAGYRIGDRVVRAAQVLVVDPE
ncbi:nucleotide exchange factor GrpE [Nocardioides sp. DS6]|uniref:Protein GrpE n=1 Tax=Nocardioides eburneus TaxID=3231482 RepID=A0ABV3T2R4_9ACTN